MHPGCVHTEITRDLHIVVRVANALCPPSVVPLRKTAAEGAYTSTHLATAPELEGKGGQYYFHCRAVSPGPCAMDDVASEELWKMSEILAGIVKSN
jgi:retinol dehydrogenase 12